MSLLGITDAFKTYLKEPSGNKDYRAFIDFRQRQYPPLTGHGLSFTALTPSVLDLITYGNCENANSPTLDGGTFGLDAATWAKSTALFKNGLSSWLLTKDGTGDDGLVYLTDNADDDDMHGLTAGNTYLIQGWLYSNVGTVANAKLTIGEYYDAQWNETDYSPVTASEWNFKEESITLNASTTGVYIKLFIDGAETSKLLYLDDLRLIDNSNNISGSHICNMKTAVSPDPEPIYCFPLPSSFTFWIRLKPYFNYDVATNQAIVNWYYSAGNTFALYYNKDTDKFTVYWHDGTNIRTMESAAYTDNASLQVWQDIVITIDLRTSQSSGSSLYINWSSEDDSWSGDIDAKVTSFQLMAVGHLQGSSNVDAEIAFLRIWPDKIANATEVDNMMRNVKDEEVYWDFNGKGLGHTRCNISDRIMGLNLEMSKKSEAGAIIANRGNVTINNVKGIFSDDQYASFDASLEQYNGAVTDKFLQNRCPIEIETYFSTEHIFEPLFTGKLNENGFARNTQAGDLSRINIIFEDLIRDIQYYYLDVAKYFEDIDICNTSDETDSALHKIMRLITRPKIYNYASNSSFENATIANSWIVSGAGATFTKTAISTLFGANVGRLVYGSATCNVAQVITFLGTKKINVGETWTFSIYILSADACSYVIQLAEYDSGGSNDNTQTTWTLDGGEGWVKFEVSHTITDEDSDRLRIAVYHNDDVTIDLDGVMLVHNDYAYNFFHINDNDGSSGVYDADDAITNSEYGEYDLIGFDVVNTTDEHPWVVVYDNKSIWKHIVDFAEAFISRYMGLDWSGTLRYRSRYEEDVDGSGDPLPLTLIDEIIGFNTSIVESSPNKIIVHGNKITKQAYEAILWSAEGAGHFDNTQTKDDALHIAIADGDYFPDAATYGMRFFAKYGKMPIFYSEPVLWGVLLPKTHAEKPVKPIWAGLKIIGIKEARYAIAPYSIRGDLTEQIWDATSSPTGAYIRFINNSGDTLNLTGFGIIGKPVYALGDADGFIHDYFEDIQEIQKNGLVELNISNDFIFSASQVDKLATYFWKDRTKKHIYNKTLTGNHFDRLVGEWINIQFGGSGEAEYIDSLAEIQRVFWNWTNKGREQTTIVSKEILEAWKKDSTYTTRFSSTVDPTRITGGGVNEVIVGSREYCRKADFYCDGTADEVQINAAIAWLSDNYTYGTVKLTKGTYILAATIEMKSNITLAGEGYGATILEKNVNDYGIEAVGGSGMELENIIIRDLKITRNASDENAKALIYFIYTDKSKIINCHIDNSYNYGIALDHCDNCIIDNCLITNHTTIEIAGIWFKECDNWKVTECDFIDNYWGIYHSAIGSSTGGVIINNSFFSDTDYGLNIFAGEYIKIADNLFDSEGDDSVFLNCCLHCEVIGNTIKDSGGDGIFVRQANPAIAAFNIIDHNNIYNATNHGIQIESSENELGANMIDTVGDDGIYIVTDSTNNDLSLNHVNNASNEALDDDGTDTVLSGNDFN